MSPVQRRLLFVSASLASLSGWVYALIRYLMTNEDPFSAYNHPLQPWMLDAHLLIVPLLLFAIGWFWGTHVLPRFGRHRPSGRVSGTALLALAGLMTLSGYLLQTVAGPAWRNALAWTHGITGSLFSVMLIGHLWAGRRQGGLRAVEPQPRKEPAPRSSHG